jgi:NifU-like protein involved in Fe-S cluster formation
VNRPEAALVPADLDTDVGADPLGSEIRALFTQLSHAGDIAASAVGAADHAASDAGRVRTVSGESGRTALGARVRFQLRVRGLQLQEVRYRAYGCPYTLAVCEWVARALTGVTLAALSPEGLAQAIGGPASWAERLGVPPERLGRLLVIEDAVRAALADGQRSGQPGSQGVRQSDNP